MRRTSQLFGVFMFIGTALLAAEPPARPQFRPAVIGSNPDSLVNRIKVDELLKKGQKDGAVMFCALVDKTGLATTSWTYRGMPGTDALKEELNTRLEGVKFTPPLYNHQPVGVMIFGTVIFSANAKPHLRILLNQDPRDIKAASDFVAPQPVIGADSKFKGVRIPEGLPVNVTGVVDLGVKVDATGNLQDLRVLGEEPPLLGFGDSALSDFTGAKFIPAFRDGDPVEADTVLPVCYEPPAEEPAG
jgi:hypothetical protein